MDLQGTPIKPGPRSTKVTNDPRASQHPIEESSGPVANDSLAAESIREGGGFNENRGAEPLGVSGNQSTLNNTDTSAATTLPSAPVGGIRGNPQQQDKYPEALGGQGDFPGAHPTTSGYVGGPTAAKQQQRCGRSGQSEASGSGSQSQYDAGQTRTTDATSGSQRQNSRSRNVKGDFQPEAFKNSSFDSEIGTINDPGRAAEQKFQQQNFQSALNAGGQRQKGVDNAHWYQPLESDQRA